MKKYNYIIIILLAILIGCEKYEDYQVDFDYSTVYFPYQQPLRTLVMGDGLNFEVGVVLGGRRDNQQQETVQYEIDSSLLKDTGFELLPDDYFSLSNEKEMIIPAGSIHGRVTVTLDSSKFLNNELSHLNTYALPFKITETSVDSILQGFYNEATESYDIFPKDYTIVVVKYINEYHGTYYHKGKEYIFDPENNPVDTIIYSSRNLVDNSTWDIITTAPFEVITTGIGKNSSGNSPNDYAMKLIVDGTEVSFMNVEESQSAITSVVGESGIYNVEDKEFYLEYSYTDDDFVHEVTDTLVFRDKGLKFELW